MCPHAHTHTHIILVYTHIHVSYIVTHTLTYMHTHPHTSTFISTHGVTYIHNYTSHNHIYSQSEATCQLMMAPALCKYTRFTTVLSALAAVIARFLLM